VASVTRGRRSTKAPLLAGAGPLARVPAAAAFLVVIAIFVIAMVVKGVLGAVLLGVLALGVGGLLAGTWNVLSPPARVGRMVVLGVLIAVAVSLGLTS
jgi:hypothetical protein